MFARLMSKVRNAGWREFVLLAAVTTLCVAVITFVEVADEVLEGEIQQQEEAFIRSLRRADDLSQPIGPRWTEEFGRDLTALGGTAMLTLMTTLVVGYLLLTHRLRLAVLLLVATLGGLMLSVVLKNTFARERPSVVPHLAYVSDPSFPSGHSMMSSVTYLTLGALLARTVARRRVKTYCVAAALLISFLVGISRVYLGVHYPTDVVAGWAAGTGWALLVWLAAMWLQRRGAVEQPGED